VYWEKRTVFEEKYHFEGNLVGMNKLQKVTILVNDAQASKRH
jgi:hypothetical protein